MAGGAARRISLEMLAAQLARKFPRFSFSTARSRNGRSLAADRIGGAAEPGYLYAVITDDPAEMADALEQDQIGSEDGAPEAPDSG